VSIDRTTSERVGERERRERVVEGMERGGIGWVPLEFGEGGGEERGGREGARAGDRLLLKL